MATIERHPRSTEARSLALSPFDAVKVHNLMYRALHRLGLQATLNWTARVAPQVSVPLLGEPLGRSVMLGKTNWKLDAIRCLAQVAAPSMLIDVGANEGQTLLDFERAGLGSLETLAFEPNPTCAYYLSKLIRRNAWRHVTVFPFALSDRAQCLTLDITSENDSGASIVADLRPGRVSTRQVVPCFALDQLVLEGIVRVKPSFLMKIDVEAAELDVIRGGQTSIRENRPLILCEVLWAHSQERVDFVRERNASLLALLRDLNYEVYRLELTTDQSTIIGLLSIDEFPCGTYSRANAHQCEYLFVPRELGTRVKHQFTRERCG